VRSANQSTSGQVGAGDDDVVRRVGMLMVSSLSVCRVGRAGIRARRATA
jgi:hypothetical protein